MDTTSPAGEPLQCAEYLQSALNPVTLNTLVENLVTSIQNSGLEFDTIAFRGLSGTLVAPLVAVRLQKQMMCIRKDRAGSCHSAHTMEGHIGASRYIVIDDLICTGATLRAVMSEIAHAYAFADQPQPTMVAVFLYESEYTIGPDYYEYEVVDPRGVEWVHVYQYKKWATP